MESCRRITLHLELSDESQSRLMKLCSRGDLSFSHLIETCLSHEELMARLVESEFLSAATKEREGM